MTESVLVMGLKNITFNNQTWCWNEHLNKYWICPKENHPVFEASGKLAKKYASYAHTFKNNVLFQS